MLGIKDPMELRHRVMLFDHGMRDLMSNREAAPAAFLVLPEKGVQHDRPQRETK